MHPEPLPNEPTTAKASLWRPLVRALSFCLVTLAIAGSLYLTLGLGHEAATVVLAITCTLLGAIIACGALLMGLQAGYRLSHSQDPAQALQETAQAIAEAVQFTPTVTETTNVGGSFSIGEQDEWMQDVVAETAKRGAVARAELAKLGEE